jgi:hypothetical protein
MTTTVNNQKTLAPKIVAAIGGAIVVTAAVVWLINFLAIYDVVNQCGFGSAQCAPGSSDNELARTGELRGYAQWGIAAGSGIFIAGTVWLSNRTKSK